jgi:hypothetical protein
LIAFETLRTRCLFELLDCIKALRTPYLFQRVLWICIETLRTPYLFQRVLWICIETLRTTYLFWDFDLPWICGFVFETLTTTYLL